MRALAWLTLLLLAVPALASADEARRPELRLEALYASLGAAASTDDCILLVPCVATEVDHDNLSFATDPGFGYHWVPDDVAACGLMHFRRVVDENGWTGGTSHGVIETLCLRIDGSFGALSSPWSGRTHLSFLLDVLGNAPCVAGWQEAASVSHVHGWVHEYDVELRGAVTARLPC